MKNLNFLKLAMAFTVATQSAGLFAAGDVIEPGKGAKPAKEQSFFESISETWSIGSKNATDFMKNNKATVATALVGGAAAGLSFLAGSLYSAATFRPEQESSSIFSLGNVLLGAGVMAASIYAYNKRENIKNWFSSDNKLEALKNLGHDWFVDKPVKAWNWTTGFFKKNETEEVELENDAKEGAKEEKEATTV